MKTAKTNASLLDSSNAVIKSEILNSVDIRKHYRRSLTLAKFSSDYGFYSSTWYKTLGLTTPFSRHWKTQTDSNKAFCLLNPSLERYASGLPTEAGTAVRNSKLYRILFCPFSETGFIQEKRERLLKWILRIPDDEVHNSILFITETVPNHNANLLYVLYCPHLIPPRKRGAGMAFLLNAFREGRRSKYSMTFLRKLYTKNKGYKGVNGELEYKGVPLHSPVFVDDLPLKNLTGETPWRLRVYCDVAFHNLITVNNPDSPVAKSFQRAMSEKRECRFLKRYVTLGPVLQSLVENVYGSEYKIVR